MTFELVFPESSSEEDCSWFILVRIATGRRRRCQAMLRGADVTVPDAATLLCNARPTDSNHASPPALPPRRGPALRCTTQRQRCDAIFRTASSNHTAQGTWRLGVYDMLGSKVSAVDRQ